MVPLLSVHPSGWQSTSGSYLKKGQVEPTLGRMSNFTSHSFIYFPLLWWWGSKRGGEGEGREGAISCQIKLCNTQQWRNLVASTCKSCKITTGKLVGPNYCGHFRSHNSITFCFHELLTDIRVSRISAWEGQMELEKPLKTKTYRASKNMHWN